MLGWVTIGQAPRADLIPDVEGALAGMQFVEHGALDLLDAAGIARVAPEPGDVPLVSRLRNGGAVAMGHRAIVSLVNEAIERCERDGAGAVLLLCTGHFDGIKSRVPVFFAELLSHGGVAAIVGEERVGVMMPLESQVAEASARWRALLGREVFGAAGDPYGDVDDTIVAAGQRLAGDGAQWIVLDCIGYTEAMRNAVAAATGVPVLLVRSIAVRLAVEAARAQGGL